jgi:hypothetical protein
MNLSPDLLRKLKTEEDLDAVMAQTAVITAGDAVAAKAAPQPVTVTAAAQGTSTDSQPPTKKSKGKKESSPSHQPGEYELKVMEKRRRNQEKLKELGLGATQIGQTKRPHREAQPKANPAIPSEWTESPAATNQILLQVQRPLMHQILHQQRIL